MKKYSETKLFLTIIFALFLMVVLVKIGDNIFSIADVQINAVSFWVDPEKYGYECHADASTTICMPLTKEKPAR